MTQLFPFLQQLPVALLCAACASAPPPVPAAPPAAECKPPPPVVLFAPEPKCLERDRAALLVVARLASIGLVASGGCSGEDVEDCAALTELEADVGRLYVRLCPRDVPLSHHDRQSL